MAKRIPPEVKDKIVQDYLVGKKLVIILMENHIESQTLYNILRERNVEHRRRQRKAQGRVLSKGAEIMPENIPVLGLFEAGVQALAAEADRMGYDEWFDKLTKLLTGSLSKEPTATIKCLGLLDKEFTVEDLIKKAIEVFLVKQVVAWPDLFEQVEGGFRLRKGTVEGGADSNRDRDDRAERPQEPEERPE